MIQIIAPAIIDGIMPKPGIFMPDIIRHTLQMEKN